MENLCAKTFQEHREYLVAIVRLKLWFVHHWLKSHQEENLSFVLRRRVDIFRKSVFWRGQGHPTDKDLTVPGWSVLERQIQTLYESTRSDTDPSTFESKAFEVVWKAIEANAFRDYQSSLADKGFQCDSLGYDPPVTENPRMIHFHITNALQPRSIFGDKTYLPQCFLCLMDKAETEFGVDRLGTGTWLNSYPRWLELFPEEYLNHMGPESEEIWAGLAFWGQFVNARGALNGKRARMFRETGRPLCRWRYSWCSFESMRAHLSTYLDGLEKGAA